MTQPYAGATLEKPRTGDLLQHTRVVVLDTGYSHGLVWSASGPAADNRHAGSLRYEGELAGGRIFVFTSPSRTELTGATIDGAEIAQIACLDTPLHLDIVFSPPLELRVPGDEFLGVVNAYLGKQHRGVVVDLAATAPNAENIAGFVDSGIYCEMAQRRVLWSAMLSEESVLATPGRGPTSGLPTTGRTDGANEFAARFVLFALLLSGASFTLVGLRLHLQKH